MSGGESDTIRICNHFNTGFHYDNPSRYKCLDCGQKFVDYGNGYVEDKFRGLAAESVPYRHETNGYWYRRYLRLEKALKVLSELEGNIFACDDKERQMIAQSVVRQIAKNAIEFIAGEENK